ncbi:MAG: methyltransferase domain-containing protein [Chloroflexi bacterium]|nr:methyltransferase domain-containing protein [Chloroflexota bacterium]
MTRSSYLAAFGDGAAVRFDTLLQNYLIASVGLLPASIVVTGQCFALDVSCGSGQWVRALAKAHPSLEAVGLHEQSLSLAYAREICLEQKIGNAYFTPGKLHRLPSQPNLFDLVRICNLTSLVPAEEWLSVLQEMVRVCRSAGHILVQEVNIPVTSSPACSQMTELVKAALARRDADEAMLAEMERLFTLALSQKPERTDLHLDLSYGTTAYKHLMAVLPPLIACLQTYLTEMHVTTEQELRELIRGIIAEVTSEKFQGTQTLTAFIGERTL